MPLKINVGVSRKVSQDYQSTGFSLNIDAELPASLIEDPNGLAAQSNHLFQLANDLLDEQVRQAVAPTPAVNHERRQPAINGTNGNGHKPIRNGATPAKFHRNGNANPNTTGRNDRGITDAQVRAIGSMTKRLGHDPESYASDYAGCSLDQFTVKQGSELIDHLKGELEKQPANTAR